MRKVLAIVLIGAAAATSACGRDRSEEAGPVVSRTFPVGNFSEIEVAGPFDVDVKTGGQPSVSARGNQNLIDKLEVEVRGDTLVVRPKKGRNWFGGGNWNIGGKGALTISVPMIRAATLAGAGDMNINAVRGDEFEGQIAGAGDLRVDSIEVGRLKLGIAGSGGVNARGGKARRAEYSIAGSGDVDAGALATEDLEVSIAGSGGIRANASKSADVSIMGSGDVEVTGGAKCSVSKAGSGNVRCS
ncbi:DUF2807 domain-containing protein [Sphingomonas lutea]|uniref:DUF2807 domain-containing protein n=1 Tax=Sphingomonas lutea TaxID=1045317 RepID=A0A7G9SI36_9SPHN|nr:head GIN domain-containing protein [Sphingomonas lutea]QNN67511.1 DUF2807 domain-containing protein [Sphingomonas lutea]